MTFPFLSSFSFLILLWTTPHLVHTASCCCQEIWRHESHLGQVSKRGKDQIRSMWNGNHLCASISVFRHRAPFQRPPYAINRNAQLLSILRCNSRQSLAWLLELGYDIRDDAVKDVLTATKGNMTSCPRDEISYAISQSQEIDVGINLLTPAFDPQPRRKHLINRPLPCFASSKD